MASGERKTRQEYRHVRDDMAFVAWGLVVAIFLVAILLAIQLAEAGGIR